MAMDDPQLHFAQSESKTLGMHGELMDTIRDNSPRIVGGLKLIGDVAAAATLNPLLITYAAFSIIGRIIVLAWGSKSHQQKMAAEVQSGETTIHHAQDSFLGSASKILHPRQYPIEASSGFSTVAEVFEAAFGASQFMAGKTGYTPLIAGILSVWSYANILFGKEKKKESNDTSESLHFAKSESKPVGFVGKIKGMLKNNPVLISSLVGISISVAMFAGALAEGLTVPYVIYTVAAVVSNVVQAMFVRKNEFNIEGAQNNMDQSDERGGASFQERLQKQRRGDPGLQPA